MVESDRVSNVVVVGMHPTTNRKSRKSLKMVVSPADSSFMLVNSPSMSRTEVMIMKKSTLFMKMLMYDLNPIPHTCRRRVG
jgi:hypothetical protein